MAKQAEKKSVEKKDGPTSMPKDGRDPEGGLTAKGRAYFEKKEGLHLKPGVTGAADTPEKQKRKGSFLARTFSHPRGPMVDEKGEPTRLALSAHAWGEPVPKTIPEAKKLAEKGRELLEQFHASGAKKSAVKKVAAKKTVTKKTVAKKAAPKKAAAKKASKKAVEE